MARAQVTLRFIGDSMHDALRIQLQISQLLALDQVYVGLSNRFGFIDRYAIEIRLCTYKDRHMPWLI